MHSLRLGLNASYALDAFICEIRQEISLPLPLFSFPFSPRLVVGPNGEREAGCFFPQKGLLYSANPKNRVFLLNGIRVCRFTSVSAISRSMRFKFVSETIRLIDTSRSDRALPFIVVSLRDRPVSGLRSVEGRNKRWELSSSVYFR